MMWSQLKKSIKEFITPQLQKRIDIDCTCYHDAHDDVGEVWITLDGNKIFGGGYYHWYVTPLPDKLIKELAIKHGFHKDFTNAQVHSTEVEEIMKLGVQETAHITNALGNYLNTPFEESLSSKNPIFKAFAFIDRRLGKRRFEQIKLAENEHPLVKICEKNVFKKNEYLPYPTGGRGVEKTHGSLPRSACMSLSVKAKRMVRIKNVYRKTCHSSIFESFFGMEKRFRKSKNGLG